MQFLLNGVHFKLQNCYEKHTSMLLIGKFKIFSDVLLITFTQTVIEKKFQNQVYLNVLN